MSKTQVKNIVITASIALAAVAAANRFNTTKKLING